MSTSTCIWIQLKVKGLTREPATEDSRKQVHNEQFLAVSTGGSLCNAEVTRLTSPSAIGRLAACLPIAHWRCPMRLYLPYLCVVEAFRLFQSARRIRSAYFHRSLYNPWREESTCTATKGPRRKISLRYARRTSTSLCFALSVCHSSHRLRVKIDNKVIYIHLCCFSTSTFIIYVFCPVGSFFIILSILHLM